MLAPICGILLYGTLSGPRSNSKSIWNWRRPSTNSMSAGPKAHQMSVGGKMQTQQNLRQRLKERSAIFAKFGCLMSSILMRTVVKISAVGICPLPNSSTPAHLTFSWSRIVIIWVLAQRRWRLRWWWRRHDALCTKRYWMELRSSAENNDLFLWEFRGEIWVR